MFFFVLITWQFFDLGIDLTVNNRVTPTQKIPVAFWWWIATGMLILCLPVQTWMIYKAIISFQRRVDLDPPEGH